MYNYRCFSTFRLRQRHFIIFSEMHYLSLIQVINFNLEVELLRNKRQIYDEFVQ